MIKRLICLCLLTAVAVSCKSSKVPVIAFCTQEQGRELITRNDKFVSGLHGFDLVSRLSGYGYDISREGYLDFAGDNVTGWTDEARVAVNAAMSRFVHRADSLGLDLPFPDTVRIVCSRMLEEGGAAGYTRGSEIYLDSTYCVTADEASLDYLFVHEMFHILTRHSPEFRKKMYGCIGFHVSDKEIMAGEDLLEMRISNPDVNNYDNWAHFTIGGRQRRCTIWLYSDKPYSGGRFFDYARAGLLELDDNMCPVRDSLGRAVIHDVKDADDFFAKVGENTSYIINAEEILADNFSRAVNFSGNDADLYFKSPWLVRTILDTCGR